MVDENKIFLGILAVVITIFTYAPYYLDIFRGRTKPHAISWCIWALIAGIVFFGQRTDNAGAGSWLNGFIALASAGIFFLSLSHGERKITPLDWICLTCSLFAIPLWIESRTPLWSMVLLTVIDTLGFLPTFRKTWSKPSEETLSTYVLSALNYSLSLFALENISMITALYPTTLVCVNTTLVVIALQRRLHQGTILADKYRKEIDIISDDYKIGKPE